MNAVGQSINALHHLLTRFLREPINSLSHGLGAVLGLIGLFFLIRSSDSQLELAGSIIFSLSVIGLMASSSIYHLVKTPHRILIFRKIDHMMIYVLIAGTYTPFCLLVFEPATSAWVMSAIWGSAFLGAIIKLFSLSLPRWFSTGIYLVMGWAAVFLVPVIKNVSGWENVIWILSGGLSYTIGAIIYATKKPNPIPDVFGFHEIWHFFVLFAAGFHWLGVYRFISQA